MSTLQTYNLKHADASGNQVTFTSGGLVGVGTSAPGTGSSSYYDDLVVKNDTAGTGAGITIQSNSTNGFSGLDLRTAGGTELAKIAASAATSKLSIDAGGSTAITVDSSQRVGIGNTSPGHRLVVRDAGSASTSNYLNVISGNAANAGIAFGDTDTDLQAGILYLNSDNALRFFKSGFTEAARIDSSGFLLVGTASSSGGIQRSLATIGACTIHSTGIIEVANNGTLDLPSVGTSIVGHLYVHSVYTLNAAVRTSKVFFLANRFGNGFTATELNSNDGTSGSRSFSITNPSNNIIRFTNTSGAAVKVTMSFVGSLGF